MAATFPQPGRRVQGARQLVLVALSCAAPPLWAEESAGVELDAIYIGDPGRNLHGGATTGNAWSHIGRAGLLWNSGVENGEARHSTRFSLMYMRGRGISARTGDLQGINNIEAEEGLRLYELWSEWRLGSGVSLRGGFLDLNAEFDVPVTSALFISPPHGIGSDLAMSGRNGPAIWPATGIGLRLQGETGNLQWRLAAFEGEPGEVDAVPFARVRISQDEGALLVGELSWTPEGTNKLQIGAWRYTARFEPMAPALAGQREHGNHGFYALADLPVGRIGATRVDVALRAGTAAPRFNTVDRYLGAVLAVSGLGSGLPDDAIGFGIAHASTSRGWRDSIASGGDAPRNSETAYELTWRHPLTDHIIVQPHLHYVPNPGAVSGPRDTWAIGLRFEASASTPLITTD